MAGSAPATARVITSFICRKHLSTPLTLSHESLSSSTARQLRPFQPRRRNIYAYAKVTPTPTSNNLSESITQTLDEAIGATRAHLVGNDKKMHEAKSMKALLSQIDRSKEHLRKVGETPEGIVIVKVVQRDELFRLQREKELAPKKVDVADTAKQIELNWAISENDLNHRLKKIAEFLGDGRHVQVMIAPRRKGRRATKDEIKDVLTSIKECVAGVEGVTEWKEQTGVPGRVMELYFKGTGSSVDKEQARQDRTDKQKKKEEEKAERRRKDELRQREKEEERRLAALERERLLKEVELGRQRQQAAQA